MVVQQLWRDDRHSRPTRIEMAPFVRHSGVVEMSAYVDRVSGYTITCIPTALQRKDQRVRTCINSFEPLPVRLPIMSFEAVLIDMHFENIRLSYHNIHNRFVKNS